MRMHTRMHAYLPARRFSVASPSLMAAVARRMAEKGIPVHTGTSWTTDAPFRGTEALIAARREEGVVSVEMEAAALLALGAAIGKPVVCLAHVTNARVTRGEDFEKGGDAGLAPRSAQHPDPHPAPGRQRQGAAAAERLVVGVGEDGK